MRLSDLINGDRTLNDPRLAALAAMGVLDREIAGLTADSRNVQPGFLFTAIPGTRVDGRQFIEDAVERGAVAIVGPEADADRLSLPAEVCLIPDDNPRERLARMAAKFFPRQPETVVAVTGTNGKTSVADFTRQIWRVLGHEAASLGTLGILRDGERSGPGLTTPDPVDLHAALQRLADDGVDHLAMEASSHGLDQHRLDGVMVRAAAFTNLSRDHLDYHGTMEAYFRSKATLFERILQPGGTAVLNLDIPEADRLIEIARRRGQRVLSFGTADGTDIQLLRMVPTPTGLDLHLLVLDRIHPVTLPLAGLFQVQNALAAIGLVMADMDEVDAIVAALAELRGVPGRLERVAETPSGAAVYVDYAHTPDALDTVLKAIRPHVDGRLITVFGCGGDRDPGKRPLMARAAAGNADIAILTDDNPRTEDPGKIRADARVGAPDAIEIGGREDAIRHGVSLLRQGDVLVVAGKGHEQGQDVGGVIRPFDDADVSRRAVEDLTGGVR